MQTAHGQMNEHALEQVIVDFWEKEFDVLVSTTIVESGLDIPNANTLILDRADMFGLSQLHQLRGRVGRGRERGYAYFLYPPEKPLTETAHDRLATIAANTDLGSGMAVAMKDLEIRGAGNLLGGEQSGHIADVGFDLYVRLVGEAVAEYRQGGAGAAEEVADIKVEMPIDAHIPHDYVAEERLRLEAYKRLAAAATEDDVVGVAEELTDRYGQIPEPVANLLAVARFRIHARRAGVTEIVAQGNYPAVHARRAARLAGDAPLAALPGHPREARDTYDPGAATDDRPGGRPAGPRHRTARLAARPHGRRPARAGARARDERPMTREAAPVTVTDPPPALRRRPRPRRPRPRRVRRPTSPARRRWSAPDGHATPSVAAVVDRGARPGRGGQGRRRACPLRRGEGHREHRRAA